MKYKKTATQDVVEDTMKALETNGIEAISVKNGSDALSLIKARIPAGASIMNGSSRTLEQIGFVEYLKSGNHPWNNLHIPILSQKDPGIQARLRKEATLSDYYLGSVHALSQTGEFVIGSNTGSQLAHVVFSSPNLIFVVGTQKIVPTLSDAMKRLEDYVIPLEDANMKEKYGMGTMLSKVVLFKRENTMMGRKVTMILVNEALGF